MQFFSYTFTQQTMIVITCRVAQYRRFTIFAMLCSATAAAAAAVRLEKNIQ